VFLLAYDRRNAFLAVESEGLVRVLQEERAARGREHNRENNLAKEVLMPRMTIELPDDIVQMIVATSEKESVPRMEVLRRIFTILRISQEEKKGNELGIVNGDQVIARFTGI
jgi:hypothetical protein